MRISKKVKMAASAAGLFVVAAGVVSASAFGVHTAMRRDAPQAEPVPPVKAEGEAVPASTHIVTRSGYYVDSYVIDFGWNLHEKSPEYPVSAEVVLPDGSRMAVAFHEGAEKYAEDENAKAAVAHLIASLGSQEEAMEVETPFVERMEHVPADKVSDFARKYYEAEDLLAFSALFSSLGKEEQMAYFRKMYEADRIDFFSCATGQMDAGTAMQYIEKTEQDGKLDFFAVLSEFIPQEQAGKRLEKYYVSDDIARFSILFGKLPETEREAWLQRAKKDRKRVFYNIIAEEILFDGFMGGDSSV